MCVCASMYNVYVCEFMYVRVCACMCVYVCMRVYVCMYVCVFVYSNSMGGNFTVKLATLNVICGVFNITGPCTSVCIREHGCRE